MSEIKSLHLFMAVVCTVAVVVAQDVNVRMPRKNVLSMTDFKNAGDTWYQMYIAESLSEDYLSFNAKLNLTVLANNDLEWSYSGQTLSTLECHSPDKYSYTATRTDKAVFESMYNIVAFVSSDPSQYLLAFQCYDLTAFDRRYCGSGGLVVYLLVKNQRPDSFPLMSAVNDVKRNTDGALTFDGSLTTRIGSAFKFHYTMIGEHSKYSNAPKGFTVRFYM